MRERFMIYAFVVLIVIIFAFMIYFAVLKARKNGTEYYMNMLLLKRYNFLAKKAFGNLEEYQLKFEEKNDFQTDDFCANVENIKKVDKNLYLIKKYLESGKKDEKVKNQIEKNIKIVTSKPNFQFIDKNFLHEKMLSLASQAVPYHQLSEEISPLFGNAKAYHFGDFAMIPAGKNIVFVNVKDVFESKILAKGKVKFALHFEEEHEVDYDGEDPLVELDFRQEKIVKENGEEEISTYVKCSVFTLTIKFDKEEIVKKIHLMKCRDIELAKQLAEKEK